MSDSKSHEKSKKDEKEKKSSDGSSTIFLSQFNKDEKVKDKKKDGEKEDKKHDKKDDDKDKKRDKKDDNKDKKNDKKDDDKDKKHDKKDDKEKKHDKKDDKYEDKKDKKKDDKKFEKYYFSIEVKSGKATVTKSDTISCWYVSLDDETVLDRLKEHFSKNEAKFNKGKCTIKDEHSEGPTKLTEKVRGWIEEMVKDHKI